MHDAGFRGHRLDNPLDLVPDRYMSGRKLTIALGLGDPLMGATASEKPLSSFTRLNVQDSLDYLDERERKLVLDILPHAPNLDTGALIEAGFYLIAGIEALLKGPGPGIAGKAE